MSKDELDSYTDYDMCSIMHYGDSATVTRECEFWQWQRESCSWNSRCNFYARKKQPCFIKGRLTDDMDDNVDGTEVTMGQKLGLTESDIRAINMRYGCKGYGK